MRSPSRFAMAPALDRPASSIRPGSLGGLTSRLGVPNGIRLGSHIGLTSRTPRLGVAGLILLTVLLFLLLAPAPALAGTRLIQAPFQVNTYTTNDQALPDVASDGRGRFIIVWESDDQDGSGEGIFGGRFEGAGFPVGSEFQVSSYTTGNQVDPSAAMNSAGVFVVTWSSLGQDGSGYGVFARRFDSAGGALGSEFQVNGYTSGAQYDPDVAIDSSGNFLIVWTSEHTGSNGIFGRMFNSIGQPVTFDFQVDTDTAAFQYFPAVAGGASGRFAVVWESYPSGDGDGFGVAGRLFQGLGVPLGNEFQVNTYTTGDQGEPGVAMSPGGDFLVAWDSDDQDGSGDGVFARLLDMDGIPLGSEFQVNTYTTGAQDDPQIAADPTGEFIVVWPSQSQDGSFDGVFGRIVNPLGAPHGAEFQVSTYTTGSQNRPSVATGPSGIFSVVWEDVSRDGSGAGVFGQGTYAHSAEMTGPAGPLDCSDPANLATIPTFTWEVDTYDTFKVWMGSSAAFEEGTRVTSGDKVIRTGSYTPTKKKWKAACRKALEQSVDPNMPLMYVAVQGKDQDLPKSTLGRVRFSPTVEFDVTP